MFSFTRKKSSSRKSSRHTKKDEELYRLYTPEKLNILKNICVFNISKNLVGILPESQIHSFISKKKKQLSSIQINHAIFERNYSSLDAQFHNIQKQYLRHFSDSPQLRQSFNLYKFWHVFLKDGELINFFDIIEEHLSDNTFSNIFAQFRQFYNLMNGYTVEQIAGSKQVGGKIHSFMIVAIFSLLAIMYLLPRVAAPGHETEIITDNGGTRRIINAIDFAQQYKLLAQNSKAPTIRDTIKYFRIPDVAFKSFLAGCDWLTDHIVKWADFLELDAKDYWLVQTIKNSRSDIFQGQLVYWLGKRVQGFEKNMKMLRSLDRKFQDTVGNMGYDPHFSLTEIRDYSMYYENLRSLGQLSTQELLKLSPETIKEMLLYNRDGGWIGGRKK